MGKNIAEIPEWVDLMQFTTGDKAVNHRCSPGPGFAACKQIILSTDGRIAAYDLRVLEDDKNLFPPYDACIVVRREVLDQYKVLREILERLSGAISVEQMRQMNYAVTDKLRSPANVAADFLETNNLR